MTQSVTSNGLQSQNLTTWALSNSYSAGDIVVRNGSAYVANADIPANTAWVESTTGATWKLVVLGTSRAKIVQMTSGGLRVFFFRTSDGKVYSAGTNTNDAYPPNGRIDSVANHSTLGIINAAAIFFYDATLGYEETGNATYVGVQGSTAWVLFDSGNLWAWGSNDFGQLGLGTTTFEYLPRRVKTDVKKVYTHPSGLCGSSNAYTRGVCLGNDNKIYACGYNGQGALGLGNSSDSYHSWTELTWAAGSSGEPRGVWNLGNYLGCIVVETNEGTNLSKYKAAGWNGYGYLGYANGDGGIKSTAVDITGQWTGGTLNTSTTWRIKDICGGWRYHDGSNAGDYSFMMMWIQDSTTTTNNRVLTCGNNGWYNLGTGNNTNYSYPYNVQIGGSSTYDVKQIDSQGAAVGTCFILLTNGDLYSWGDNRTGSAGNGGTSQIASPTKVNTLVSEILLTKHTQWYNEYYPTSYIRKTDGSYWSCGRGAYAQRGDGTVTPENQGVWQRMLIPKSRNSALTGWYDVNADGSSLIPVMYDTDGILWSWGRGDKYSHGTFDIGLKMTAPMVVNPSNI